MDDVPPPAFAVSVESGLPPEYDESGPANLAASAASLVEREYPLADGAKPLWAVLKVRSRPDAAASIPSFTQGEAITGTVELHLEKAARIHVVTIEARGEAFVALWDPIPFLTLETTLWSSSMAAGSDSGSNELKGDYVWPFSITLPDSVAASVVEKGSKSEYLTPPSFSERASSTQLVYKLLVTIRRGRLRTEYSISTRFAFLPRSHSPAPSALRQLAYRENTAPPEPKGDPEGWEVLGTKSVTGSVFKSRQTEVLCSFALAKPLQYTRGTFIPFSLTLDCPDTQALDLLTTQGSLTIRLVRSLSCGAYATEAEGKHKRADNTFTVCAGQGVSWLSSENITGSGTRKLEGEIPLWDGLKPSFVFPRLSITYKVTFDFTAPGFSPLSQSSDESTFSREVIITTDAAPGLAARSRIPRAMEAQVAKNNHDVLAGMLTAANQRILFPIAGGMG